MRAKVELRKAEGGGGGGGPCRRVACSHAVSHVHDAARAQPMNSYGFKHGAHHIVHTTASPAHLMSVSRLSPSTSNTMQTWRPCGPACSNQSIMRQQ